MGNAKIRCWNKTHKNMKCRLAIRIATSASERWLMEAAKYRTNTAIGRPRKRWEDDIYIYIYIHINEFLKLFEEETENLTESSSHINKTWINTAKDHGKWTLLEENYTLTSEERQENVARTRRRRKITTADQRDTSTE